MNCAQVLLYNFILHVSCVCHPNVNNSFEYLMNTLGTENRITTKTGDYLQNKCALFLAMMKNEIKFYYEAKENDLFLKMKTHFLCVFWNNGLACKRKIVHQKLIEKFHEISSNKCTKELMFTLKYMTYFTGIWLM